MTIQQDKHGRWFTTSRDGRRVRLVKPDLAPSVRKPARTIKGPSRRTVDMHRKIQRGQ